MKIQWFVRMYSDSQDERDRKSEQNYTKHRQKSWNVLRNDFSKTFYIHASVPAKNNVKELPLKRCFKTMGWGRGKGGGQGRVYWSYRFSDKARIPNFTLTHNLNSAFSLLHASGTSHIYFIEDNSWHAISKFQYVYFYVT